MNADNKNLVTCQNGVRVPLARPAQGIWKTLNAARGPACMIKRTAVHSYVPRVWRHNNGTRPTTLEAHSEACAHLADDNDARRVHFLCHEGPCQEGLEAKL